MKNRHGIEIKECCASCLHKEIQLDGTRVCKLMNMVMESGYRCIQWQMSEELRTLNIKD